MRFACDVCRSRKVRCDGHFPCRRCQSLGYGCAYLHAEDQKTPTSVSDFQIQRSLAQPIGNLALISENEGVDVAGPALQDPTILPDFSNCIGNNPSTAGVELSNLDLQGLNPLIDQTVHPGWPANPDAMDNPHIDAPLWDSANLSASSSGFHNMIRRENIPDHGEIANKPSGVQKNEPAPIPMLFSQYVLAGGLNIGRCIEQYFTMFHPLWPIVHRGTFGLKIEDAELIDSVVMIGAWESGVPSWMEAAIDVRPKLVSRILGKFVSLDILILVLWYFQQQQLTSIPFDEASSANQRSYSLPTKPCS